MTSDRKATLSVMSIIIALSMVFLAQTAHSYRQQRNDSIQHNIDEARRLVESNLSAARALHKTQLRRLISHHSDLLGPFHQRDRQRLYEVILPVFQDMQEQHSGLTNMHFHLPDGRSFLRMHRPDEYGDDLTTIRPLIAQIHRDGMGRDGYEFGVHGLFYRVAEPVRHEGRYSGVVEFGVRPDVMIKNVEAILGVQIALHAGPASPRETRPDDGAERQGRFPLLWTGGRDSVFWDLPAEEIERAAPHEVRTSTGRLRLYRAGEIRDFQGDSIGHLLIAQDIGSQTAQYHRFVLIVCLVAGIVVTVAYVILRLSFGHMIQRIVSLNRTLEHKVRQRTEELSREKKKVEATNTELSQIFETAAGGLRVIGTDLRTVRVNKTFKEMVGLTDEEILGRPCYETFPGLYCHTEQCPLNRIIEGAERVEFEVEKTHKSGRVVPCLLTATPWRSPEGELLGFIEDFTDITTIKTLVEQQAINIGLAQRILSFINSTCLRYVDVDDSTVLFSEVLSSTCHAAGGDHYFMRQLPPDQNHPAGRTVLSLKDQSGHEVNCVLKGIATDLVHNTILHAANGSSLGDETTLLNRYLVASSLFSPDEFITAINVEIDHATGMLEYVSCGHPPFLVIRGQEILSFPEEGGVGRHLPLTVCQDAEFTAGRFELKRGDKLVFYTDGLTEMPMARLKEKISTERLKHLIGGILEGQPTLPVSQIIRQVLDTISEMSQERVTPGLDNTSSDDVTVLGLEVESQEADVEKELYIANADDLSARIVEFTEQIGSQARENGFELDTLRLRLVLDEALSNAWRHGHGCNAEKPILLRWRFRNDAHIEVVDQGPGFDYHHLEDPTEGEGLLGDSGRGLFMIRLYADRVRWEDGGRRITFSFERRTGPDRRTKNRLHKACCLNIWQH